jgi:hypothetical protein
MMKKTTKINDTLIPKKIEILGLSKAIVPSC